MGTSRSLRFNMDALRGTVAGSFAGHRERLHHANHSHGPLPEQAWQDSRTISDGQYG